MKYPIGIQSYESLRRDDYVYVDKTALIYQLVTTGRYYFLSRPRRFGKSLLISTLQAYFEGKRELFEGLAIADLEKEWTARPVLHLDMNTEKFDEPESLRRVLDRHLLQWEIWLRSRGVWRPNALGTFQQCCATCLRADGPPRGHPRRRVRQTALADFRQAGAAGRLPQHAEGLLLCLQDAGPVYQAGLLHRCDEVLESQRLQRPEQPGRYFDGCAICPPLRNHRRRDTPDIRQ